MTALASENYRGRKVHDTMWKRQNEWGGYGQNVAEKTARLLVRPSFVTL